MKRLSNLFVACLSVGAILAAPCAWAGPAVACDETSLSRAGQNYVKKVKRNLDRIKYADEHDEAALQSLLKDVDEAIVSESNCYNASVYNVMRLYVLSESEDPYKAVPALEALLNAGVKEDARRDSVTTLLKIYKEYDQTDAYLFLAEAEARFGAMIEFAALSGKLDIASKAADTLLTLQAPNVLPNDLYWIIAVADRQGDETRAEKARGLLKAFYDAPEWLEPIPGLPEDKFDEMVDRRSNPVFVPPELKRYPLPNYPVRAAERGLEGTCNVVFRIDSNGAPQDIKAFCNDPLFVTESEIAIRKVRYERLEIDGNTYSPGWISYPIDFNLN